jgi:hypothetical protein
MLRMTSKRVKNAVDKLRPPAIVRLSRTFLDDVECFKRERLLHPHGAGEMKMTSRCRITIFDLENCGREGWNSDQRCLACIFRTISLRVSGDSQESFRPDSGRY